MKRHCLTLSLLISVLFITSCNFLGIHTYNIEKDGIPRFVNYHYIELDSISRISRFRSGEGHDYSDHFETCRSMKHYYVPYDSLTWNEIPVYAPVSGEIVTIREEWAGTQVEIRSRDYPAFNFIIFHVYFDTPPQIGDSYTAGEQIGTHIGTQTTSDIAVNVNTKFSYRLISYFEVMTDSLFECYMARGIACRDSFIISQEARDADPLTCSGDEDRFSSSGNLENWVQLNKIGD